MDHSRFRNIKCFVFDVDGVLTDGSLLVTESGELLRTMSVRDGQGLKQCLNKGYHVAIITKGNSKGVKDRLMALGIKHYHDGVRDKAFTINSLTKEIGLSRNEILYMGDDLPDLSVTESVGIFSCPSDAAHEVIEAADYISPIQGGRGCAREIIERTLRIQDTWTS